MKHLKHKTSSVHTNKHIIFVTLCTYKLDINWTSSQESFVVCEEQKPWTFEPRHEITNNVICATSKGSDSLRIRAV